MISIKNLTKEFSGQKVLDGIDIDIEKGEVVALVGASGAGKSTILRSLNYLEQPDSVTPAAPPAARCREQSPADKNGPGAPARAQHWQYCDIDFLPSAPHRAGVRRCPQEPQPVFSWFSL